MKNLVIFSIIFMSLLVVFGCGDVQESGEYPFVQIKSPGKASYARGEKIEFSGWGHDRWLNPLSGKWEEKSIVGDDLLWTSDIDGQIGIGETFNLNNLSTAIHIVTLTGIGYNQVKTSTSVKILIIVEPVFNGEVNYVWYNNIDLNWIVIDGTVKNNTNSIQDGIKMELTVRDGNKKLLGTNTAYLSSMKPGETATFYSFITHAVCSTSALDLSWKFLIE